MIKSTKKNSATIWKQKYTKSVGKRPFVLFLGWPLSNTFIQMRWPFSVKKGPFPIKPFEPGVAAFQHGAYFQHYLFKNEYSNWQHLEGHIRLNSNKSRLNSNKSRLNSKIFRVNSNISRMDSMKPRLNSMILAWISRYIIYRMITYRGKLSLNWADELRNLQRNNTLSFLPLSWFF